MAWGQIGNIRGPQGPAGTGVQYKGSVADDSLLPQTGNAIGDMWIAEDTGHAHIVTGLPAVYVDAGQWLGPEGPQGTAGVRGSLWYNGTGSPTTIVGERARDHYLDLANGNVYEFS